MMATRYQTKDGEMLDWICWRHYGQSARLNDAARQLDPHLAKSGGQLADSVELIGQFSGTDLRGVIEQVLNANHGLADQGSAMPAGIDIYLPDIIANAEDSDVVSLWDD